MLRYVITYLWHGFHFVHTLFALFVLRFVLIYLKDVKFWFVLLLISLNISVNLSLICFVKRC